MAEPARKPSFAPQSRAEDHEPGITLLRWVEGPDGEMEQMEIPLTPELFLNPQLGDKWMQGRRHQRATTELYDILANHFLSDPEVMVSSDLQHVLGPGLSTPAPDISVVRGIRDKDADLDSFNAAEEGAAPCLIIEVVSPKDSEIRRTDLERKVRLYQRAGVEEYIIVDSTRKDRHFRLLGYRLDETGRYRPIPLDSERRLLSETTGLWFQIAPDGERVLVFEHPGGRRLLNLDELQEQANQETQAREAAEKKASREAQAREAAEKKASREEQAREAAEAEVARLKAELDRLRGGQ